MRRLLPCLLLCLVAGPAYAALYSFTNAEGQYVVSQEPPKDNNVQYAVLTDEGEFIRMVPGRNQQIPITHWRPWFIPKEPHPWDGDPAATSEREGVVTVEEESAP